MKKEKMLSVWVWLRMNMNSEAWNGETYLTMGHWSQRERRWEKATVKTPKHTKREKETVLCGEHKQKKTQFNKKQQKEYDN